MYNSFYDSFLFPSTRVIVVSEERLREVERAQKQREIELVEKQLSKLEGHLEGLREEYKALPSAEKSSLTSASVGAE